MKTKSNQTKRSPSAQTDEIYYLGHEMGGDAEPSSGLDGTISAEAERPENNVLFIEAFRRKKETLRERARKELDKIVELLARPEPELIKGPLPKFLSDFLKTAGDIDGDYIYLVQYPKSIREKPSVGRWGLNSGKFDDFVPGYGFTYDFFLDWEARDPDSIRCFQSLDSLVEHLTEHRFQVMAKELSETA